MFKKLFDDFKTNYRDAYDYYSDDYEFYSRICDILGENYTFDDSGYIYNRELPLNREVMEKIKIFDTYKDKIISTDIDGLSSSRIEEEYYIQIDTSLEFNFPKIFNDMTQELHKMFNCKENTVQSFITFTIAEEIIPHYLELVKDYFLDVPYVYVPEHTLETVKKADELSKKIIEQCKGNK